MNVRIYGKVLKKWCVEDEVGRKILRQMEIEYKEYDTESGELVAVGSEDFSPARYKAEVRERRVFTWDGEKFNRGGFRWFEDHGVIKFRTCERKLVLDYLKTRYSTEKLVQLR